MLWNENYWRCCSLLLFCQIFQRVSHFRFLIPFLFNPFHRRSYSYRSIWYECIATVCVHVSINRVCSVCERSSYTWSKLGAWRGIIVFIQILHMLYLYFCMDFFLLWAIWWPWMSIQIWNIFNNHYENLVFLCNTFSLKKQFFSEKSVSEKDIFCLDSQGGKYRKRLHFPQKHQKE